MAKRLLLLASMVLLSACVDDPVTPVTESAEPAYSHVGTHAFTGRMLGPDGASLCGSLWDGAEWRLTFAEITTGASHGNYFGTCPADEFHFDLQSGGTYLTRVVLPATADLGSLPRFTLTREPMVMSADIERDIRIEEGETLAGGITVDGQPIDDVLLGLQFADLPTNFLGADAVSSGRRGPWQASYAPVPMRLQAGVGYRATTISLLGVVSLGAEAPATFVLGDDLDEVTLRFRTSRAARSLSHDATRLTVTPLAGIFGGGRVAAEPPVGRGWGVQFPDAASHTGWSQLFDGGLTLLVNGRVLSGLDLDGHGDCTVGGCRDLGVDGSVRSRPSQGGARAIEWRYSDAGSSEAVGLEVVQQSFDGADGDYVLFHFTVRNASGASVDLNPGMFMDWDLDGNASDDVGETPAEFGGRLMLQTNQWGGNVLGTLLVGAGAANPVFIGNFGGGLLLADQIGALSGTLTQPNTPVAGDWWYMHSGAAVALAAGESTDFWIALVAGESRDEAIANAAAAESEIATRTLAAD